MKFIDPAGKPFAHLARLAVWQAGHKAPPITLEWDLSNRCVLGCQSCHFAYTHTRGPWASRDRALPAGQDRGGDLADTAGVLRVLREVAALGVQSVVWTGGGEPTTHPDWQTIVTAGHHLGLQQGMYTLGGLLEGDDAQTIAQHLAWVVVSLDAVNAVTYTMEKRVTGRRFTAACHGIRDLADAGALVGVSFLLHGANWAQAPAMIALARSLGARYTTLRPTIDTAPDAPGTITADRGWVTEALPLLRALAAEPDVEVSPHRFLQYRDWAKHEYATCHGIKLNATITPDLRVWVCPNRRERPDSCLGDLSVESFAEVWARHPGHWADFTDCRAMCRLHIVNETLADVFAPRAHEAFI